MSESTETASLDGTTGAADGIPDRVFFAPFTPENNSGALGIGRLILDGDTLTLDVVASGLTPGQEHPFHLHRFTDGGTERLPTAADDTNGDGLVQTAEAAANAYGPVVLPLTVAGNGGAEAFPTADANGTLTYSRSITLDPNDAQDAAILAALSEGTRPGVLNLHGLDLSASGVTGRELMLATPPQMADGTGAQEGTGTTVTTGYDPNLPVSAAPLLAVPEDADARVVAALADADSATFLAHAEAVLSALAPHTLDPTGTGPLAPEDGSAQDGGGAGADSFLALLAPANNSGAFGAAAVRLDEAAGTVEVHLAAEGLTPDQVHGMHIHGFADDRTSLLPNFTLDSDRDGFVEDQEGEPALGPVILGLTQDGSVSDAPLTAPYPRAGADGSVTLDQTYHLNLQDPAEAAIFGELTDRLAGRAVQIHGLEVTNAAQGAGTGGEVDGHAGYVPELPVANGILLPADGSDPAAQDMKAIATAIFGSDLVFGT